MSQNKSKVTIPLSVRRKRHIGKSFITKIFCAVVIVLQLIVTTSPARAISCDDVHFVFARGSGENLSGASATAWKNAIMTKLSKTTLTYSFYELGSKSWGGAQYPAVAVSGSLGAIGNLVGAYISAGSAFEFGRSVEEGEKELKAYIKTVSSSCPNTKFVLGGYSQGAMLVSHTLSELDASKIIYVANFGDPKLYLPEGKGLNPDACRGRNLSNYRTYVSDCRAYEGVLGSYRPYQPEGYYNKIGVWCHGKDIMCSSGFDIADHSSYVSRGLYLNAAEKIYQKLQSAFPDQVSQPEKVPITSKHDLVIFINTGGYDPIRVNKFVAEASQLASSTRAQGGRVALYIYADRGKLLPQELCDFSCTEEEFEHQLTLAKTKYLAAGDAVESGLSALKMSMTQLEWQVGATKSAVLFSPHHIDVVDRDGTTIDEVIELSLKLDPVNVYSFITPNSYTRPNQVLADATGGKVYTFEENQNGQAFQEILRRPIAELSLEEYSGIVGEEFYFDASGSRLLDNSIDLNNDASSATLRYDWDLDADGIFEIENSTPSITKTYQQPIEGFIQVRVTDSVGHSSNMSARLRVTESLPASAQIQNLSATEVRADTYQISFQAQDTESILITLDDAVYGYIDASTEQNFLVHDVEDIATVSLTPYNSLSGRGEAKSIQIGKSQSADKDESTSGSEGKLPGSSENTGSGNLDSSSSGDNSSSDNNSPSDNSSSEATRPDSPSDSFPEVKHPDSSNSNDQISSSSTIHEAINLIPVNQPTIVIPKVPNTGVISTRYRELKCQ